MIEASTLGPERIAAGHAALDTPLRRLDGGEARLRDHLGDPLLVLVWASW